MKPGNLPIRLLVVLLLMSKGSIPIRRQLKSGEVLHGSGSYQQRKGNYMVVKMKSKKDVAMKRAAGFTEAKISGRWRPIASVQIRVPSSASTRRREMGAASRKSQVLSKRPASKKPASRKPACLNPFKMAVTDAWCICMVADVRRGSARTEMNHMRVRTRTFVQGVDGKRRYC